MNAPSDAETASARRMVALVGLAFLVAQLAAFSPDRPPSWDEAIYLSQVTPGAEPLLFVPSRARGVTFLALPVLQLGGSLQQLRLFLALASAAALTLSFRAWVPVIGLGAVAAALLFAGAWPTLFYGSELMPNLWMALLGVAATAVLARRLSLGHGRYDELVAGGLVAVAALLRPLDAFVLTTVLVLVPIAVRRATLAWTVHLLLGLAAGCAPWLVEMTARFESPWEAFGAAARLGHTGRWSLVENARQYLALSDGPSIGPVARPEVPASGLLWVLGLAGLVVAGIRASSRRALLPAIALPTTAGLVLAAEYVVFTDAQAPRFLLPALAMLAVPAGLGLASIIGGILDRDGVEPARVLAAVGASILVVAWATVQLAIAGRVEAGVAGERGGAERIGLRIRRIAAGDPCHVFSDSAFPVVGFSSGCRASPLPMKHGRLQVRTTELTRDGVRPFIVTHGPASVPAGAELVAEIPDGDRTASVYAFP